MEESFLHFVWKYKLYFQDNLKTTDNEPLEIRSTGTHNYDSGPDFSNARIKIENTIWAGNVEIHLRSSDWNRHKHFNDDAYQNVILHVVYEHDKPIYRKNGTIIPVLKLEFDKSIFERYTYLQIAKESIGCSIFIHNVDSFFVNNWIDRLGIERIERKSKEIKYRWERNNKDLEQTFYEQIAISFGLKVNAAPFEQLTKNLSLKTLMHHCDSVFQLEALLFGCAGFLEENPCSDYQQKLTVEYNHLKNKYGLKPLEKHQWKFMLMRPGNFPTIRIAQFASVINNYDVLFSKIINTTGKNNFEEEFLVTTSLFWDTHYTFEKTSPNRKKKVGKQTLKNIVINSIAPFLFFYGDIKNQQIYKDKAVELIQNIPFESNHIVKNWEKAGVKPKNAFESQALIQLFNEYCKPRKCINCQIGNYILSKLQS